VAKTGALGRAATPGLSERRRIETAACLGPIEPIQIILRHNDPKWVNVLRIEFLEQQKRRKYRLRREPA